MQITNNFKRVDQQAQRNIKKDEQTVFDNAHSVSKSPVNNDEHGKAACWGNFSAQVGSSTNLDQRQAEQPDTIHSMPSLDDTNIPVAPQQEPTTPKPMAEQSASLPPSVLELQDEICSDEQLNPGKKGSFLHGLASWVENSLSGLAKRINGLIHRLINLFAPADESSDSYKDYR